VRAEGRGFVDDVNRDGETFSLIRHGQGRRHFYTVRDQGGIRRSSFLRRKSMEKSVRLITFT